MAADAVRHRALRVQPDGLGGVVDGRGELVQPQAHLGAIGMRQGMSGKQQQRRGKVGDGRAAIVGGWPAGAAGIAADHRPIVARFGVVRVQPQRPIEVCQGCVEITLRCPHFAAEQVALRLFGLDFDGGGGVFNRPREGLQLGEEHRPVHQGRGVAGVAAEGLVVIGQSQLAAAAGMAAEATLHVGRRFLRHAIDVLRVIGDGRLELLLLLMERGPPEIGRHQSGVVWIFCVSFSKVRPRAERRRFFVGPGAARGRTCDRAQAPFVSPPP